MRLFGEDILPLAAEHVVLAVVPVLIGLVISLVLGWWAWRVPAVRRVLVPLTGVLYTIPSLALFVVMPLILGTRILDPLNVAAALVLYAVALLVRTVVDGLDEVPDDVMTAAVAMGYRPGGLLVGVQLPLAVPVLIGGLRVATVSSFSLVAVGAIIGQGALGALFTQGFERFYTAQIVFGLVSIVVLALIFDALWVLVGRLLAPWTRAARGPGRSAAEDDATVGARV
ncbi:ABC transporter permease subunit [Actinomycetospora endophytica]|uniref:ABC transporter permease subunit n=1 Tax=Actinomycetospora endophytica TaxID=2291215 RepID=A0ABS8PGW3_9PSEU|nr:ABC transporter permease subunit [Actinomycetospora endophytica]MCD2197496.1 ABC transporter permease subunit [Actinomycetospora endophytica]